MFSYPPSHLCTSTSEVEYVVDIVLNERRVDFNLAPIISRREADWVVWGLQPTEMSYTAPFTYACISTRSNYAECLKCLSFVAFLFQVIEFYQSELRKGHRPACNHPGMRIWTHPTLSLFTLFDTLRLLPLSLDEKNSTVVTIFGGPSWWPQQTRDRYAPQLTA